jgi:N-acetylglucosamine-6-sulfatase
MFFDKGGTISARRRGVAVGVLWCIPALVAALVMLGTTPGPAGGPSDPAGGPTDSVIARTGPSSDAQSVPGQPAEVGRSQPNIVVIMLDDMRADDLNGPWMQKTNTLLGDAGVRFANTFVPLPLCCPARSSFLTGQYPHNHGVWEHDEPWGYPALDDDQTLPVWLQDAGYNTMFLGKYLNGYDGQDPETGDIDGSFYVPPGWSDWKASLGIHGTYNYNRTVLNDNGRLRSLVGEYQTRAYGRIGSDMIQQWAADPNPFFFWLNFTAPHTGLPCERPDPGCVFGGTNPSLVQEDPAIGGSPAVPVDRRGRYDDLVQRAPGVDVESASDSAGKPLYLSGRPELTDGQQASLLELTRQRYEAESIVDDQVARLIATLKQTGELDNTVVMLTSDNGFFLGEHRIRIGKIYPYEPSIRVPLLMRGPGIPSGQVRTDPFSMIDFAPTIMELAQARPPVATDGISMLSAARDGDRGWQRALLTETGPRDRDAAIELDGTPIPYDDERPNSLSPTQGARVESLMYVENIGGFRELYDLRSDPNEMHNLANDPRYRRQMQAFARILDQLRGCEGAECDVPVPPVLRPDALPSSVAPTTLPEPPSKLPKPPPKLPKPEQPTLPKSPSVDQR